MIVPNVKLMSQAIEAHILKHKKKAKDPKEAEIEAERIRDELITQILDKWTRLCDPLRPENLPKWSRR